MSNFFSFDFQFAMAFGSAKLPPTVGACRRWGISIPSAQTGNTLKKRIFYNNTMKAAALRAWQNAAAV